MNRLGAKTRQRFVVTALLLGLLTARPAPSAWFNVKGERTAPAARRLLVNDDGEVGIPTDGNWDAYLAQRFRDTVGTQVDTYFLNVAATDRGPGRVRSLQSTMAWWMCEGEVPAHFDEAVRRTIRAAHDANQEIFASVRMNDMHDVMEPQLNYPLKVARPDLLIGSREQHAALARDSLLSAYWAGLDYARPEVRDYFLTFIRKCARTYDFDGVELDFCRGQVLFKPGQETENVPVLTDYMRRIRAELRRIGRARGRPYLLTARVLSTPEQSLAAGLDVETWLAGGLLDLLIVGGGVMPYSPHLKDFIDMAHRYGIPAYPCINHFRDPLPMRSMAAVFHALGGDGVYIFNYFGVPDGSEKEQCLSQLGDPAALRGFDKEFPADTGSADWGYGHERLPAPFPIRLIEGTPIRFVSGDEPRPDAPGQGLELRILCTGLRQDERIRLTVNGLHVPQDAITRPDADTFLAQLAPGHLRRGINEAVILPGPGAMGRLGSAVTGINLSVRYRPGR